MRAASTHRRRSERFLVGMSVAGVLLVSLLAAATLFEAERAADQARLDGATASFASVLRTELERLSDAGTDVGVALSLVSDVDPAIYAELMELLAVESRFPGVFGIAMIEWVDREDLPAFVARQQRLDPDFRLRTDGGEPQLRIVSFHHPLPQNAPAIGIDVTPRGETRVAADQAVASGEPVLSDATVIAQLDASEPGVVIHAPVPGRDDRLPATVGMVLSGQQFVAGLEPLPGDVALRVTDPTSHAFTQLAVIGTHDPGNALTATADVTASGNTWRLETSADAGFTAPFYQRASSALALGGLLAASLVGLFVRSLVSRERMATEVVEQRTLELSSVNARLADSNAALADSNRTKDAFLASVSHELRTPLTVIAGFVESMQRLPDGGDDPATFLAAIERNVRRLDALVSDLLTATSLDARAVTAFRRAIDLRRVLAGLPGLLVGVASDVRVTVHESHLVEVDPRHLERVLVNLIVNADRHGAPPIEVTASSAPDGTIEVRVRDHGPGIPTDELDRLFERFARGEDRENVPGTGLGLSIVRELTELNGGQIRYEPANPGACFVLRLEPAASSTSASSTSPS